MGKKWGHRGYGDHNHFGHHEIGPMHRMHGLPGHHWNPIFPGYHENSFKHRMKSMFAHGWGMLDSNGLRNQAHCTLCWHQIKPLVETEVLECGHLYHRMCLKEVFANSQSGEQSDILCNQCRQPIDTNLVTEFQNRFNAEPTTTVSQTTELEDSAPDMEIVRVQ